jgi:hypothetical protein
MNPIYLLKRYLSYAPEGIGACISRDRPQAFLKRKTNRDTKGTFWSACYPHFITVTLG